MGGNLTAQMPAIPHRMGDGPGTTYPRPGQLILLVNLTTIT